MPKFDLASVLGDVSKLDTGLNPDTREQIEYIDISLIDPDPNNFYELTDIDELAANIELIGLQQPLRVRAEKDNPGRVMVVSGHRRRAALELLVKEGKSQFAQAPCIREAAAASAALQELRLIYANSDTRKLSSAEISKQAERVEALLYQLKEDGMEFPGRMRDHVAEACKVSKSKLARLKVIREHLDQRFMQHYEAGNLTEAAAYVLAQQPVEIQRAVFTYKCTGKNGTKYLAEWEVKDVAGNYSALTEQKCKKCGSGKCEHAGALLAKIYDGSYSYKPCKFNKCCNKCENLASCKTACPMLADKIKRLKADKKEAKRQEKLAQEEREKPDIERITALWQRFGIARQRARKSVKAYEDAIELYYNKSDDGKYEALEKGLEKITLYSPLPYGHSVRLLDIHTLIQAADCLGCSLDYLFCRTDVTEINSAAAARPREEITQSDATPQWRTGQPEKDGLYWIKFVNCGCVFTQELRYVVRLGQWHWPSIGLFEEGEVIAWYPLPED